MRAAHVFIVRHGETDANVQCIIQGHQDTDLNELGKEQAALVGLALQDVPFATAWSSDLTRTMKTAAAILEYHPQVPLMPDEALRERYLGELQGQSLMKIPPDAYKSSSIEQMDAVALRAITWWKSTLLRHIARLPDGDGSEPEHILVVSHGGFIGVLLRSLVGSRHAELSPGVKLAPCLNTAICVIRVEDTKGKVLSYGDVRHLKKEAVQSNADEAA